MNFLLNFLLNFFYDYIEVLFKIVLCSILTGIIGYNREKNGMTVGIRTHILVGLSAVTVQIMSLTYLSTVGDGGESSLRAASSFTQAVGFIGAGAIMKDNRSIKGLTTAASIFFVACIGLSVGLGVYVPAILITLFAYLFLIDAFKLKKLVSNVKSSQVTLSVDLAGSYNDHASDITRVFDNMDVDIDYIEVISISVEKSKILIRLNINDEITMNDILSSLVHVKAILKTEIVNRK